MQPEYFIERKKLKQQILNWKVICVILIAAVMTAAKLIFVNMKGLPGLSTEYVVDSYIGSIYIDGMIMDDKKRDESLKKIYNNDKIKALIVYINSPGGTVTGSEELYNQIRKIGTKKPVVAVMNTLAASGGYMTAIAADYIVAHNSTITGSIGVIWQNFEITDLAEKLGVTFQNFKSSPLKASPNLTEKVTPEMEAAAMELINDSYNYFVEVVTERRKLPKEQVIQIANGKIYTGRQAYELKLVDRLGSTDEALQWLYEEKKIDQNLKVVEVELKPKSFISKILGDDIDQKISNLLVTSKGLLAISF
jgi:protease-4